MDGDDRKWDGANSSPAFTTGTPYGRTRELRTFHPELKAINWNQITNNRPQKGERLGESGYARCCQGSNPSPDCESGALTTTRSCPAAVLVPGLRDHPAAGTDADGSIAS